MRTRTGGAAERLPPVGHRRDGRARGRRRRSRARVGGRDDARAACCRWCGRGSRSRTARWCACGICRSRAARRCCVGASAAIGADACERTFTETAPALPARQRVSARFRARLFERRQGGAAHAEVAREERTTRYQVTRAFATEATRCSRTGARARAAAVARRGGASLRPRARDRRRPRPPARDRSPRRPQPPRRGALSALAARVERAAIEVVSIDPMTRTGKRSRPRCPGARIVADPFHLVRGANTALDTVRRERQRVASTAKIPKGARRAPAGPAGGADLFTPPPTAQGRERLIECQSRQLCVLFVTSR